MKTTIYSVLTAIAAALASSASAQNLEESVTVEGRYTPVLIAADRLPVLPSAMTLTAPDSRLEYDEKGVAANFAPDALPMPATGWRTSRPQNDSRGYLRLRLGSWLNSSLSAGVAAIDNDDTRLNVRLQHNSTSLWQAWKADPDKGRTADADRRFRYDETIGADLRHRIPDAGSISASLQYHLGYFNYYGTDNGPVENNRIKAPTQTVNDVYAAARWTGEPSGPVGYELNADVRHFAYRAMYIPSPLYKDKFIYEKGNRETELNIGGNVAFNYSQSAKWDIGLRYTGLLNSFGNDINRLRLTPAYNLTRDNFSLRIGMEMAVVSAEDTRFRIAPDIRFSARSGITALTASIGGGTALRTLARIHAMDYYANPSMSCTEAAYSPIDARLALQLNPGGRWTLGLEGMWRTTLDETFGGLYQAKLNRAPYSGDLPEVSSPRIHGFSLALNAGYQFCRQLTVSGKGSWQPQHGNTGVLNGFDRPTFTAGLTADIKPIDRLSIAIDYNLRARRELLRGNISRLDFSAEYRVTDRLSIGAEVNNLLNRHEQILPGIELEGLNAAAGCQIVF